MFVTFVMNWLRETTLCTECGMCLQHNGKGDSCGFSSTSPRSRTTCEEKQTPAKQAWSRPKGFPAKSTTSQSVTVFPLPCARSQIDQIKRVKKKTKLTTCYPFAVFIVHHVLDKCTRMINTTVSHSNNDSKRKPQTSRALQSKPSGRIHLYSVKQQDLNNVGHLQTLTAWKFMKLLCITQTRNPTGAPTKHSSNNQNRFNNWTTL